MHTIGIDIGRASVMLCRAVPGQQPQHWPTHDIPLKDDWAAELAGHLNHCQIVALEPTGYWYSRPIIAAAIHAGCRVLSVSHTTTATHRAMFAAAKTDAMDARALAAIASAALSNLPRGSRFIELNDAAEQLRLALNEHQRHTRTTTRLSNQIGQLTHAIMPGITAWRVINLGVIDPDELDTIASGTDGYKKRPARAMLTAMAPNPPAHIIRSIEQLLEDHATASRRAEAAAATVASLLEAHYPAATAAWRTIPGTGDNLIGALIIATHGQPEQLTVDEFKACIGVQPISSSSGQKNSSRPSRKGYKPARVLIHMWTLTALRQVSFIQNFHAAGHNLSACKRKAAHLFWGVLKNPPYRA